MDVIDMEIPEVKLIRNLCYADRRGSFREIFQEERYHQAGIDTKFVQDNISVSGFGVLRGLHYQMEHVQGKLITILKGKIYDVVVDLRKNSPYFGSWMGGYLSADENQQLWVPPGFAHGFLAVADETIFSYKCTDYYDPISERTLLWNDPDLDISWPLDTEKILLSDKDIQGTPFKTAEVYGAYP